ncbi:ARMT1-like domain-containing protein [Methanobrevibacter sp.]|uniref:damage-control phosphatase ARMT1 family protein n=1 Tax=Methanobrevibacter sp. TaxID=66852 RepID=UPI0025E71C64|nr:ARMT1-like domain-containing protein [Methanobrevibacter sp.]MBQ2666379.1 DUF89 family protein [Methanobrevibacter sp.]MBQ2666928.1 DUF89 family protein [Methanobrevibacter sp.]
MKLSYECGACIMRQVGEVLDLSTDDEKLKFELMQNCIEYMSENFKKDSQPNKLATEVNQYIKQKTQCSDAYIREKQISNEIALSILPDIKDMIKSNDDLETYVKLSIVGNILDFGAYSPSTDFEKLILKNLGKDLSINDTQQLENALKHYSDLLYLVDNTGEIVFDRLLIEKIREYDVNVTVAVKSSPIVNDACKKEAIEAGLDQLAEIVTVGSDMGGIVEEMFSCEFREIFDSSDFIISKGMANYEGLTEMNLEGKDVFSLLCCKCKPISKSLSVDLNSFVAKKI